jgi:hypothetical protein
VDDQVNDAISAEVFKLMGTNAHTPGALMAAITKYIEDYKKANNISDEDCRRLIGVRE